MHYSFLHYQNVSLEPMFKSSSVLKKKKKSFVASLEGLSEYFPEGREKFTGT